MANLKLKNGSLPKLIDCYGNEHEVKLGYEFYNTQERLHNKKLIIARNIQNEKVQKRKSHESFYKTKTQLKIEYKASKQANYLEAKSQIKNLETKISEFKKFIKFSDFIKVTIKNKKHQLNNNWKVAKKTIESLRQSHDLKKTIDTKIKKFGAHCYIREQLLLLEIFFLEKLSQENFVNNNLKFWKGKDKNWILVKMNKISIDNEIAKMKNNFIKMEIVFSKKINNKIIKLKENLVNAFFNQIHFKKSPIEISDEINKAKEEIEFILLEKHKKKLKLEFDHKKITYQKSKEINLTYFQSYLNLKSSLEEYKEQLFLVKKEINQASKNKKQKINQINEMSVDFEFDLKNKYKQIAKEKIAKLKNKKNDDVSYYDVMKDYRLYPLLNWKEKIIKLHLKANYYIELGNKIKDYTYEGDYKIGLGQTILKFSKVYKKIVLNYFEAKIKLESKNQNLKQNNLEKESIKLSLKKRQSDFEIKIGKLKHMYQKKQISKKAYKNAVIKENIFFEEDIKLIKMQNVNYLLTQEKKSLANKLLIDYHLAKKMCDSHINEIRKKTPIEVKRNSAYWKVFLGTLLPGSVDLLNKNWQKGILMLLASIFMYSFLLPYVFGEFNIKGKGIIGLVLLSWEEGIGNDLSGPIYVDSRYSLVEGVIALIFLIITIVFILISTLTTWKIVRGQEIGIRSNDWFETSRILKKNGFPYAISMPGWILIIFIVVVPIIVSILLAFTDIGHFHNPAAGDPTSWVGFRQFVRLLNSPEIFAPFWIVFSWNFTWAISTTLLVILLGTLLAFTIETQGVKGKIIWRTIYMLPWAIPAFLSILFFKVIFSESDTSLVNKILLQLNIIDEPILWRNNIVASRTILVLIQGWLGHSYIVLLISGYMKSISQDVYEAASMDGANKLAQFFKITAPIILMQITPLLIGQFIFNFNNFTLIFLFNHGGGSIDPTFTYQVGNADILLSWIFKITFTTQGNDLTSNQALASAAIMVMSIVMIIASSISFSRTKAFKKSEEYIRE